MAKTNPQNVLVCVDLFYPDFSGAGLRAKRLCERLTKKTNLTFQVIALANKTNKAGTRKIGQIIQTRLDAAHEDGISFPIFLAQTYLQAKKYLARNKEKISQIHLFSLSWMNRMILLANAAASKKPTIAEITLDGDDDPHSLLHKGLKNKLMSPLTRMLLKKIDLWIVGSEATRRKCIIAGINPKKVKTIPRPIDELQYCPASASEKNRLRSKLRLPDKIILINIGMLCERKNQSFLVECLGELKSKEYILALIGPEDKTNTGYKGKILRLAEKLGVSDQIILAGRQEKTSEWLKAADIFVFSSLSEGFPNALAEAALTGLPTIATRLDQFSGTIPAGAATVLKANWKNKDLLKKEMARAIRAAARQKNKIETSQRIRAAAEAAFSSRVNDSKYIEIYSQKHKGEKKPL